jgi:integrase
MSAMQQYVLDRAFARAGLVTGYRHICRRQDCGHGGHARARRCPKCNMEQLLARRMPRRLRFHDLRATTATLLARAGVALVIAQRILRHSDPRLTANIYSRVDLTDLQAGIDRLGIRPNP